MHYMYVSLTYCFYQDAFKEIENVEQKLKQLSQLTQDLAEYFCEDESKFKLEELLVIFKTFCNHLDKAKEVCFLLSCALGRPAANILCGCLFRHVTSHCIRFTIVLFYENKCTEFWEMEML